jgi:hypothetical protein
MLFVATAGADAVYEAQGSWSQCTRRILELPLINITKEDLAAAAKKFSRNQYATLPLVMVSFLELETLGLQRVDK